MGEGEGKVIVETKKFEWYLKRGRAAELMKRRFSLNESFIIKCLL